MHQRVRRMPAERARHPKRLGHVFNPEQALAAADTPAPTSANTPASQTPSSSSSSSSATASAKQSSSATATPSSSSSPSSSSAAATTSSSTTSLATSASAQSSLAASSPPLSAGPTSSTSASLASLPTSTPQSAAPATSSGLSGSALAGVIAGAVIVGVALIVFFVRKTYLRRRERKRISWIAPDPRLDDPLPLPDVSERSGSLATVANASQRSVPFSPFEAHGQPMYPASGPPVANIHPPTIPYGVPTPPSATYNNPSPVTAYPAQPLPSAYAFGNVSPHAAPRVASTLPSAHAQHAPMEAIVKCTFVPTLPDELSITTGERVFVVEQYDDGWDLCANGRGERGMVPRECLERAPSDHPDVGWRNVKRTSSLNSDGRRY